MDGTNPMELSDIRHPTSEASHCSGVYRVYRVLKKKQLSIKELLSMKKTTEYQRITEYEIIVIEIVVAISNE